MYEVKCKCGKSAKSFKKDLGMEFCILECCELAGFNHLGDEVGVPKFEVKALEEKKLKDLQFLVYKYDGQYDKARSPQTKERCLVNRTHARQQLEEFKAKLEGREAEVNNLLEIKAACDEVTKCEIKLVNVEARVIKADTKRKKTLAAKDLEKAKVALEVAQAEKAKLEA